MLTKQAGRFGGEASARKEAEAIAQIRTRAGVVAQAAAGQGSAPQRAFEAVAQSRVACRTDVGLPGLAAQDDVEISQGFSPAADGYSQLSPHNVALVAVGHLTERQLIQLVEGVAFAPDLQERFRAQHGRLGSKPTVREAHPVVVECRQGGHGIVRRA